MKTEDRLFSGEEISYLVSQLGKQKSLTFPVKPETQAIIVRCINKNVQRKRFFINLFAKIIQRNYPCFMNVWMVAVDSGLDRMKEAKPTTSKDGRTAVQLNIK